MKKVKITQYDVIFVFLVILLMELIAMVICSFTNMPVTEISEIFNPLIIVTALIGVGITLATKKIVQC